MEEQTKILDSAQSEETPLPETMEIENPSFDSSQFDGIVGGFDNSEDAQTLKTLAEISQEGKEIEDVQTLKTLEGSDQEGGKIVDAEIPKTLDEEICREKGEGIEDSQTLKTQDESDQGGEKKIANTLEEETSREKGEEIQDAQTLKTLDESDQGGEKIVDAQIANTLEEETSREKGEEIQDAQTQKTLDESCQEGGEKIIDAQIPKTLDEEISGEKGKEIEGAQVSELQEKLAEEEPDMSSSDKTNNNSNLETEPSSVLDIASQCAGFGGGDGGDDDDDDKGFGDSLLLYDRSPYPYWPYHGDERSIRRRHNWPFCWQCGEYDLPLRPCLCDRDGEEGYGSTSRPQWCWQCHEDRSPLRPCLCDRDGVEGYGSTSRHRLFRERERRRRGCPCGRDCGEGLGSKSRHPGFREREIESRLIPFNKWKEPEPEPELYPVGAGLANLGNTCFLNAILQCFTHTVPLVQGLQSLKHESSSHGNDVFCVLCAVRDQIEHSLAYSGRMISPSNLVNNLSQISSFFRRHQQEDAHEFLQCLLDKLDSNWSSYESNDKDSSSPDSLVKQVFGGRLVSQVRCCKCGHISDTYEPLIDLSLEIEDADSLESALKSFTKVESIADTENFKCEGCKEQVPVEKQLLLDQAPSVAALHLKRFKSDGVSVEKIDKDVKYPLELDLEPYTKGGAKDGNEELKYELFAFVVHVGYASTSGHYFCYIRTSPDTWYRFDDSKVTKVKESSALSQDAYILFYARKGTAWFSSLIEKWKASSDRKPSPKSVLDGMDLPSSTVGRVSDGAGPSNAAADGVSLADLLTDEQRHNEVETTRVEAITDSAPSSSSGPPTHVEVEIETPKSDNLVSVAVTGSYTHSSTGLIKVAEIHVGPNHGDETRRIDSEKCSPSPPVENMFDGDTKNVSLNPPLTPPRSASPGIYSDEEETAAEVTYRIPVDHLKVEDKATLLLKKSKEKAKHDMKRKEAARYMCKSMPSRKRLVLMAAMDGGPRSDSCLNKNKRRKPSNLFHHSPKKRLKISPKRASSRPVTA